MSLKTLINSLFSPSAKPKPLVATARTGRDGEAVARRFLLKAGYRVHACNVRMGRDEIDLVVFDPEDGVLAFVEVKSRSRQTDYAPALNITPSKKASMRRAARRWVAKNDYDGGWRLDVVCVVEGIVTEHLREVSDET